MRKGTLMPSRLENVRQSSPDAPRSTITGTARMQSERPWLFGRTETTEEQAREVAAKVLETAKNAISFIAAEGTLSQAGPHINSYGNLIEGVYPEFRDDVDKTKKNAVEPIYISHTV